MLFEGELMAYGDSKEIHCNGKMFIKRKNGVFRCYKDCKTKRKFVDPTAFKEYINYLKSTS